MSDTETYDDILGYDADHDDPSQYCVHGTFIGSWWGPDYLCHWCESGISVAEMIEMQRAAESVRRERIEEQYEKLRACLAEPDNPFSCSTRAAVINWLVIHYHPAITRGETW